MSASFFPVQDPVLIFALLMLIALLAPLFAARIKVPGIVGLIVTGIIIGPHALGVLDRGYAVELLGTVGLLYIMFLAGLELDRIQFIRHREHTLIFGSLTFSAPLILGTLMAYYILGFSWAAAILLASMFSSHTLMTYPIASRLGLSRQRAVTTTIGGTILTDTAALLVLAIIAALHTGEPGIFFWPRLFGFMAIYVAAAVLILPRLGKWFFRNIATDGVVAYTGVLAGVFICSYFAHVAGLEPIIGAFLAGLIFNSLIPEKSALMNRIQFVGHSLFIPFFLISVGMLVNLSMMLTDRKTIIVAGVMVFAGLTTKWLAAFITQKILRYTSEEGNLIYGLSVNQAAATLAAVLVGYNIGIFGESVLTGTIIMILVTTLVGSWITDRYARKVALKEEEEPYQISETPHRILIPLSNPDTFEEIMNLAMLLRRSNSHEPLYPIKVVQSGERTDERIAEAEKLLGKGVVLALEADIPVNPVARVAIDNTSGIVQATVDLRISTIVTGWRGDVVSYPFVFGKTLDSLIDNTTQMIFVSRCLLPVNTMKRVVMAVPPLIDHQPGFATAVNAIKTLTHQLDASILTVSVPPTMDNVKQIVKDTPPKIQESEVELESWDQLMPWLDDNLSEDDLLIVISVRKGRLAWQPNLSRIPRLLNQHFSEFNHVMVYPPETPWGEISGSGGTKKFQTSFLPPDHISLELDGTGFPEAIVRLLNSAFPGNKKTAQKIAGILNDIARSEPMELSPGVILLHAHVSEIQTSTAFLGINRSGWELPHSSGPIRVLLILLSSTDAPPELHLKALADLVRPLHHFEAAEQLMKLTSVEEVLDVFSGDGSENTKI